MMPEGACCLAWTPFPSAFQKLCISQGGVGPVDWEKLCIPVGGVGPVDWEKLTFARLLYHDHSIKYLVKFHGIRLCQNHCGPTGSSEEYWQLWVTSHRW